MQLSPELEVIHQPVRLKLMAVLYRERDVGFTEIRDKLALTDGNLATHAARLSQDGLLEARRVLLRGGFEVRYRITTEGSRRFQAYLGELRRFVEELGP